LDVNGGITGSVKGNLDGVAAYATTIVVANAGTTTDTSLFPTFTTSPVLASYTSLYSHASSSFFFNGVTRRLHMEGFVVSGSNNIAEISGSLNVSGSTSASAFNVSTFGGTTDIYHTGGGHTVITNTTANKDINYQTTGTGEHYFNSDVNVTNGNIVIATAGKGIDFSATSNGSGTMTSELLNDYEEGTWTPTYTGTNITINSYGSVYGYYTKVGRLVTLTFCIMTESVSVIGSEYVNIGGLPFAAANVTENTNAVNVFDNSRWTSTPPVGGNISAGTSTIVLNSNIGNTGAGQDPTRVVSSNMATGAGNRNMVRATVTYFTA
jgi:hypothetical protein